MFEKFGEFDSFEEINKKAKELMEAADTNAVRELALENGLDPQDAEDYLTGSVTELCTDMMAALGKLDLEEKDLEISGILKNWTDQVRSLCMDEKIMVKAVRKKGKSLAACMAVLIRYSFENKVQVSGKIVDITKVTVHGREEKMRGPLWLGFPDTATAKRIIREYYTGRSGGDAGIQGIQQ